MSVVEQMTGVGVNRSEDFQFLFPVVGKYASIPISLKSAPVRCAWPGFDVWRTVWQCVSTRPVTLAHQWHANAGPLTKPEFVEAFARFKVREAFPTAVANYYGFCVDPLEPNRASTMLFAAAASYCDNCA